ncbi:MAG: Ni/Fe hydrogenase subunit alpha [Thermodesulfovibrionales bacterium]|nr:Ni/Fe hydrogenase subunit alpha [Nitrospinota bacterium]MCG2708996.1 Ni/Fe hydrogenase subunit alpha [Thermodesulfovibrionales bacterium]
MKIDINYIARVEGESSVKLEIEGGKLKELKLNIWEPPRFFEGFLVGRKFDEVPDIVARICGICPVSHMTTAIRAIENAFGLTPSPEVKRIRKILSLSQILSSHLAHLYVLALPDYFRLNSIVEMLPHFEKEIKRFLRLKEAANSITALFGGRALHPVSMVVGGFTKVPSKTDIEKAVKELESLHGDALETLKMVSELKYPALENHAEFVALKGEGEYAINEGAVSSTKGLNIKEHEYAFYFIEDEVPYSNAKRTIIKDRGSLMAGALSRINLGFDNLLPDAKKASEDIGFKGGSNPFLNNLAQAVEIVHALQECAILLRGLSLKDYFADFKVREGAGSALTEAPRGMLYHHYEMDRRGIITKANIVTPTAHNFLNLEESLKKLVTENIDKPEDELILTCEMLVRAYDPCFSCSVH